MPGTLHRTLGARREDGHKQWKLSHSWVHEWKGKRGEGGEVQAGGGVDQRSVEFWNSWHGKCAPRASLSTFKALPDALWKDGLMISTWVFRSRDKRKGISDGEEWTERNGNRGGKIQRERGKRKTSSGLGSRIRSAFRQGC
jgi:hypothetical protein